jgi:hypothetical protein
MDALTKEAYRLRTLRRSGGQQLATLITIDSGVFFLRRTFILAGQIL